MTTTPLSYPQYTREEKLSCKLTSEDIARIKELRASGETYRAIAEIFGVTHISIMYWCWSEEKRKERGKGRSRWPKNRIIMKRFNKRKQRSLKFREYKRQLKKEWESKNRDKLKEYHKKWKELHRDEIKKYASSRRVLKRRREIYRNKKQDGKKKE